MKLEKQIITQNLKKKIGPRFSKAFSKGGFPFPQPCLLFKLALLNSFRVQLSQLVLVA